VKGPPAWLSPRARLIWKDNHHWLKNVLASGDAATLAVYCETFATFIEATELVRAEGMLVVSPKRGNKVRHPGVTVVNQARIALLQLARELGLSPCARGALGWTLDDVDKK